LLRSKGSNKRSEWISTVAKVIVRLTPTEKPNIKKPNDSAPRSPSAFQLIQLLAAYLINIKFGNGMSPNRNPIMETVSH